MGAYRGCEDIAPFIINLGSIRRQVEIPSHISLKEGTSCTHRLGGWVSPGACLDIYGKNPLLGFKYRIV
jgi:hypothetical protein